MFDIKDKVVLITGGAAGIGASSVRALLDEGIKHVTILDISEEDGIAFQEELNMKHGTKAKFIKCDVTQEDQLFNAFKTVKNEQGYIDILINSAGILNDKIYATEVELNVTSLIRSTIQAWELMRKDTGGRGGTVINIGSISALGSIPLVPIYSATKSAILKFSTTLGDEMHYSRTGVRIIVLCIGVTTTKLIQPKEGCSFDSVIEKQMLEEIGNIKSQTAEHTGQELVEVCKKGSSGSVWVVSNGKPALDVTDKYIQSIELFRDVI